MYKLSSQMISIDYYTDEEEIYPETDRLFSNDSIWDARVELITFLIDKQRKNTIVYFPEISIHVSAHNQEEPTFLSAWSLQQGYKKEYSYKWNWENEALFLQRQDLYRQGDKELLAIEQDYHSTPKLDEDESARNKLKERLAEFARKYANVIKEYAPAIGILSFFLQDYAKAFYFLTLYPSLTSRDLTYRTAERLEHDKYGKYMKKFDVLYDNYRPPFGS